MGRNKKNSENLLGHRTELEQKKQEMVEEEINKVSKGINDFKLPSYMSKEAKQEFRRIKPLLENVALTGLDFSNLIGYLNAYSLYTQAQKELSQSSLLVEKTVKGVTTQVENPLLKVIRNNADEMRKFSSLIGLTYNSRYQIATNKVADNQNSIDEEFGDI